LAEELKEVFRNGSYERNVDEISESSMSPWSETFSPAIDSFPSSRVTTPDDSDLESLSGKRTETEGTIKTQALTSGRETMKLDVASEKGNNDKSIESYYEKIEKDLEVAEGQILYLDRENQSQLVTIKKQEKEIEKLKLSEKNEKLRRTPSLPSLAFLDKLSKKDEKTNDDFRKLSKKNFQERSGW